MAGELNNSQYCDIHGWYAWRLPLTTLSIGCPECNKTMEKYVLDMANKKEDDYEGYEVLREVLEECLNQAAKGKGLERHGNGLPFMEQNIMIGQKRFGMGFALGQVEKKCEEAFNMKDKSWVGARRDLLGAIVYASAAIIYGDNTYGQQIDVNIRVDDSANPWPGTTGQIEDEVMT